MSTVDDPKPEQDADEWYVESPDEWSVGRVDHDRRAVMIRFTKYMAPAMVATLLSTKKTIAISHGCGS
jgi:hypothetical protein